MKKYLGAITVYCFLLAGTSSAQVVTNPLLYNDYEITSNSIELYHDYGSSESISIDGSKFCEYIMAVLMTYRTFIDIELVTIGSETKYRFLFGRLGSTLFVGEQFMPANLCGIGFLKKTDGTIVFEIMVGDRENDSYTDWEYYEFLLAPSALYYQKVAFDYTVSSVINFYDKSTSNNYIEILPPGTAGGTANSATSIKLHVQNPSP